MSAEGQSEHLHQGLEEDPCSPEGAKPGTHASVCRTQSTISLISIPELKYCRDI